MRSLVVLLVTCVILVAGCSGDSGEGDADSASWLGVLTADGAEFDGWTLRLEGVDQDVLLFTDRPERRVAHARIDAFIGGWVEEFGDVQPNAVLSWAGPEEAGEVVIELDEPALEGEMLSFSTEPLDPNVEPPDNAVITITLFVDNLPSPCSGCGLVEVLDPVCMDLVKGDRKNASGTTLGDQCNFHDKNLDGYVLNNDILSGPSFENADLSNLTLTDSWIDTVYTDFSGATMAGIDLSGTTFCTHLDVVVNESGSWNTMTAQRSCSSRSLTARFQGANLEGADLSDTDLRNANLSGANLRDVNFRGADVRGADFSNAAMAGVVLTGWSASGADFTGVDWGAVPLAKLCGDGQAEFCAFVD